MATWTDSGLKDFLRHPIGYLSGDRALALEGAESDAYFKTISEQAHSYVKSLPMDTESLPLFDASNLSPEAAVIYKASLSRNVQDTNDALDHIGGQAEPEQQAHSKQADPLDLKQDRAGEAAYQQTLRANGQAMTDSMATKTQADPVKLAAAWSSTQPTKENLEAAKPAQVAPALAASRRPKI